MPLAIVLLIEDANTRGNDVSLRHISSVVASVMADIELKRAAVDAAAGKEAGAVEAPASSDREETALSKPERKSASNAYGTQTRPALRLVMGGRGRAIAHNAKGRPQPRVVARPMLRMVGGREHHTRSG
jgi:hypothetical protein